MLRYIEIIAKLCSRKISMYRFRYLSVCCPPSHLLLSFADSALPDLDSCSRDVSWSANSRNGSRASSICCKFASLQTRNNAPRLPSLAAPPPPPTRSIGLIVDAILAEDGVGSSSGATRRNQDIVLIALASFNELVFKLAMRFVAISCIASSACFSTLEMSGDSGYNACRRLIWAFKSNAEA